METRARDINGDYFGFFSGLGAGTYDILVYGTSTGFIFPGYSYQVLVASDVRDGVTVNFVDQIFLIRGGQPPHLIYQYAESNEGLVYDPAHLETRQIQLSPDDPPIDVYTIKYIFEPNAVHFAKIDEDTRAPLTGGTFTLYEADNLAGTPYRLYTSPGEPPTTLRLKPAAPYDSSSDPNQPVPFIRTATADAGTISLHRLPLPMPHRRQRLLHDLRRSQTPRSPDRSSRRVGD